MSLTTAPGPAVAPPAAARRGPRRRPEPVLLLSLVAALTAAAGHAVLFGDGSANNDEVAYLLQARALAEGELFLDVPQPAEAHQPWFFVERVVDGSPVFVAKYLPLLSALMAVGLRLTGSVLPVLALLAGLVPLLTAALAREVGLDRRGRLLAAGLVSLSPLVLVQSMLPLSYVAFLVLVQIAWLLLLRLGEGRAGPAGAALLGLAGSAAACVRPYDAVLLLGPGLVWVAVRRRDRLPVLVAAVTAGALPLAAAVAAYDTAVTGRPWTLPFALLTPQDALGFGERRMFPEDDPHVFGPAQALHGLAVHFGTAPLTWFALGAMLVPAAVLSWRRPSTPTATRVLLASAAVHLAGYAVFWGPWNYSVVWRHGPPVFGPVYAVPLLVPVVLAGLPVLRAAAARRPGPARLLVAVAGVACLATLAGALGRAAEDARRIDEVLGVADQARATGPLRVDVDPPYLGHPVSRLVEDPLAATSPVPPPGAPTPLLLQLPRTPHEGREAAYVLSRTRRLSGTEVPLVVQLAAEPRRRAPAVRAPAEVLVVERGGRTTACALPAAVAVALTPTGATGCEGSPVPRDWPVGTGRDCPDTSCVVLVTFRADGEGRLRRTTWRRLPVATTPQEVSVLADAEPVRRSGGGWLRVQAG